MADIDQLYKRAEEAFQKKNYDYARDLFLNILQINPDHSKSRQALRATVIRKFQEQGATGRIKLTMLRGQIEVQLRATKDSGRKIDVLQKHLLDDPANTKYRGLLADLLFQAGHYNGAAEEARFALEADSSNIPAAKVLVQSLIKLGRPQDAAKELSKVQAHAKEDRDLERLQRDLAAMQTMNAGFTDAAASGKDGFRSALKDAARAEELEKRQHLIQTDEEFQAVTGRLEEELNENPTDAKIPRKIGDLYFERKKDYKTAQEWYRKASQLAPQDSVLRDKVDDCTLRTIEAQIEAAAKANDPKLREMKISYLKVRMQSYERRVQDRPTDMGLRFELGKVFYQLGKTNEAIGEFQQSVKDPKRKSESHTFLAKAFQAKKMYDMAEKQYEQAAVGVLSQERQLDILYNQMICAYEAKNKAKAIEIGKKIMEEDISYRDTAQLVEKWQGE